MRQRRALTPVAHHPLAAERAPRRRSATLLALTTIAVCSILSGCGEQAPGRTVATVTSATGDTGTGATGAGGTTSATTAPSRTSASVVARLDVSSDRNLAEGKVHIAAGAPSDTEVRREIKALRKAGIRLPSGNSSESFEAAQSGAGGAGPEIQTPETAWNPRFKPIADWIVPILQWASEHGWKGNVTSGYRTYYEQAQLNAAGAFSARAGLSNHETATYPGGAVDVTEPSQLLSALRAYPGVPKLIGGVLGAVDPEHFSATGD